MTQNMELEPLDRQIINVLQGGFPVVDRPFAAVAQWLDVSEAELVGRLEKLLETGVLSRFGPLFDSERLGGAVTLAAMVVPSDRYEQITEYVNAQSEVAHNYARDHRLNMWFVLATESPEQITEVINRIEADTGLEVFNFPKEREYFIGLRLEA